MIEKILRKMGQPAVENRRYLSGHYPRSTGIAVPSAYPTLTGQPVWERGLGPLRPRPSAQRMNAGVQGRTVYLPLYAFERAKWRWDR